MTPITQAMQTTLQNDDSRHASPRLLPATPPTMKETTTDDMWRRGAGARAEERKGACDSDKAMPHTPPPHII